MEYDYQLRRSRSVTGWDRINSGELLRSSLTTETSSPWTRRVQRANSLPDLSIVPPPRQRFPADSAINTVHEPERYRPDWWRNSWRSPWYHQFQYRPRFTSTVDFWPAGGARHSYAQTLGPSWYLTSIDFGYMQPYNFRGFVGRPMDIPFKTQETRSSLKGLNLYERGVIDFHTFDRYFLRSAFVAPVRTSYDFAFNPVYPTAYYRHW